MSNRFFIEWSFKAVVLIHLLIWLDDCTNVDWSQLRADIPWNNPDLAFQVCKYQKSKRKLNVMNEGPTTLHTSHGSTQIKFHHPSDAFALNLRTYIASVLPALRCHMDVQSGNGQAMVLRYVTDYVTKSSDSFVGESLNSSYVQPYTAAYRFLQQLKPL